MTKNRVAIQFALAAVIALALGAWLGDTAPVQAQMAPTTDKSAEVQPAADAAEPNSTQRVQQSGGPDAFGYRYQDTNPVTGGCSFNFINIASSGISAGTGDDSQFSVPIGFNFTYYGSVFSTATISTNGLVAFGTGSGSFSNSCPQPITLNDLQLSPFWDDGYVFAPSSLLYQTTGVAPNRIFVIQWNNTSFCCSAPPPGMTYQVQLMETSNIIAFMYLDVQASTRTMGDSATIGIDGPGATNFLSYSCNPVGGSLANGRGIFFFPPGVSACAVQSGADLFLTKTDSVDPVIAGNNFTYNLTSTNNGPGTATDVRIADTLPAGVQFVSATPSAGGSCVVPAVGSSGGTVTCTWLGATGTGAASARSVSIVVTVPITTACSPAICPGSPGTNISNTGTTTSATTDPSLGNNSATQLTNVRAGADVEITDPTVTHLIASALAAMSAAPVDGAADAGTQDAPAWNAVDGALAPQQDNAECVGVGDFLIVTQSFSNTGPLAFTPQRDNPGPEWESILPGSVIGLDCRVLDGGGTCTSTATQMTWDGTIAVGASVTVQFSLRIKGAIPTGTIIPIVGTVHYDGFNIGQNTFSRSSGVVEVLMDCPSVIDPNTQLSNQVHLPILNFLGQDDVCESWIEVQNLGCINAKAALVTWGEPGFCPPQAAGPLKVECTGLLKPGSSWNLYGAQVPTGSKSGILFKLSARQLSEDGIDVIPEDDITGDYVCEVLFFNVVGDADDYRRFKKAYDEGLIFDGIDMSRAAPQDGALAVDVHRTCPGDVTPGVDVTSKYNGIAGTHLGVYDAVYGGYGFYVPLVYASKAGYNSMIYIQNGGLMCSSIEIWFQQQEDCLRAVICDIATLAPGETYQLDANDCVGPDFQGSAWIRSTQRMGIVVDIIGHDLLMTYAGEPAEINYTFDPRKAVYTGGNQVGFAPLVYSEYQGWDSAIQVQNLSPVVAAKVKVYFLDRGGDIITTLVDWVCPRGSQTFFLPLVAALPGNWVGSARVESQEWISPGNPNVLAPNVVAVATLIEYSDAARTAATQGIAYNLLPEHKIFDWQIGERSGGNFEAGVGLIAIPSLLKDLGSSQMTSEIAIANVVPKPGFTDLVIYVYDQNGLIDYICQKLNEKQVEYIDLQTWGWINNGFKGSAVISAWFWEHDVFDGTGFFLRNLVGLGAMAIERRGARLGEDVPGDEAAGERGIPFESTYDEDGNPLFEYCFMGWARCRCARGSWTIGRWRAR